MRKNVFLIALAALAVALTPAATARTSKTVAVSVTRTAFVPKNVAVMMNDSVKWTNKDNRNHQVVCQKCPFTSPVLKPGQSYTYQFKKAGKFAIGDALRKTIKGSVTVKPPPKGVSLTAHPTVVTYRNGTELSGAVSNGNSGETVFILGKECGQDVFTQLVTVTTTTGGNYATRVAPKRNTAYEAKWRGATSQPISIRVRVRIRLAKLGAHKFRVRVRAAQSFQGSKVIFQRFRPVTDRWVRVRRVKLKGIRTIGETVVSGQTFKSKVKRGRKVRIRMKTSQVAPCYLGGFSNTIHS